MKVKKVLALALVLALAMTLLPTAALGAEITASGGWTVKEVTSAQYDYVQTYWSDGSSFMIEGEAFYEGLARVEKNEKWGWIDVGGKEVIPCQYDNVSNFFEGLAAVQLNGKWGYIDITGKEVMPCKYDRVREFSEGIAPVNIGADRSGQGGKWGYIDTTGTEVVPCKYDNVGIFCDGFALVNLNGQWGLIDKAYEEVIPCKYDIVTVENFADLRFSLSDDFIMLGVDSGEKDIHGQSKHKWGFVNTTGVEVVPCKYDNVREFSEGMAPVNIGADRSGQGGKWGYVDETGAEVVPCKYDAVGGFFDGLAVVQLNGKCGIIDTAGQEVISCTYDDIRDFSEDRAAVKLNDKWGFIDKAGAEVIPCRYEDTWAFSEALAMVMLDGKCGFIDKAGAVVIPFQYSSEENYGWFEGFSNSVAVVGYPLDSEETFDGWNSLIVINKAGEQIIPGRYFRVHTGGSDIRVERAYNFIDEDYPGGSVHTCNQMTGIYDVTGKEIIPCKYAATEITHDTSSFAGFYDPEAELIRVAVDDPSDTSKSGYYFGFIDRENNEVIPCQFENASAMQNGVFFGQKDGKWKLYSATKSGGSTEPSTTPSTKPSTAPSAKPSESPNPSADPVAVTGVSVAKTASVQVGKTKTLTATVKPSNAANKGVYWTSDDASVVTVNRQTGKLTGVKEGTANVTVTTVDGGFTATCAVTVTKASSGGGGGSSGGGGGGAAGGGGGGGGAAKPSATPSAKPTIDTSKPASENFSDVVKDSWYEASVTYVVQKGLFNGVAQGQFAPQQNMTRAMLVTVLARLDGQDTAGGATWYAKGTDWAKAQGVSDGTMLDQSVTREQMVTMLYRYAKAQAGTADLSAFADGATVSDWAKDAMAWAVSKGILTGKDGSRLDPQGTATRAEVATILQRFVEKK